MDLETTINKKISIAPLAWTRYIVPIFLTIFIGSAILELVSNTNPKNLTPNNIITIVGAGIFGLYIAIRIIKILYYNFKWLFIIFIAPIFTKTLILFSLDIISKVNFNDPDFKLKSKFYIIIVIIIILAVIYIIISLKKSYIYHDKQGIWYYSGILPWNKGSIGIHWCNINSIVYRAGFFSWICNSYTIVIENKYNGDVLTVVGIWKGNEYVKILNQELSNQKLFEQMR